MPLTGQEKLTIDNLEIIGGDLDNSFSRVVEMKACLEGSWGAGDDANSRQHLKRANIDNSFRMFCSKWKQRNGVGGEMVESKSFINFSLRLYSP